MQYRVFQKIILEYPKDFEADVLFYEPLKKYGFYTEISIPLHKKAIAILFEKIFLQK
jgi:hypothetical protein